MRLSTVEDAKELRRRETVSPAAEKTLSEEADVAGMQSYFWASTEIVE